jgi:hypothetical protein
VYAIGDTSKQEPKVVNDVARLQLHRLIRWRCEKRDHYGVCVVPLYTRLLPAIQHCFAIQTGTEYPQLLKVCRAAVHDFTLATYAVND